MAQGKRKRKVLTRAEARLDAAGRPVARDAVTGLVWQGCVMRRGTGCEGAAVRGPWEDARAFCDEGVWGGFDDWVLPDAWQIQSIVDLSTTAPAIDTDAFQSTPSLFAQDRDEWWNECTWTGQHLAQDDSVAWAVMVNSGDVLSGSGVD